MYVISFPSGGIELTVFSAHFKVELDVVDIQSQRVDRFGKKFLSYLQQWIKAKNFI